MYRVRLNLCGGDANLPENDHVGVHTSNCKSILMRVSVHLCML